MEKTATELEHGLITFIEKTSSATYQTVLSRLYILYSETIELNTNKIRYCLTDFFSALYSLGIFPINDLNSQKLIWDCVMEPEVYHTVICYLDSETYQYPISRLYRIYIKTQEEFDKQYLQKALDDFFNSLKAQRIEPIDETRLRVEFPEEHTLFISNLCSRFNGKELIMARVGWSYDKYIISYPRFYPKK